MMLLRTLPSYLINGLAVALGIGLIHALCAAAAGPHAAQVALSGAGSQEAGELQGWVARALLAMPY